MRKLLLLILMFAAFTPQAHAQTPLWANQLFPAGTSPCSGTTPTQCGPGAGAGDWQAAGVTGGIPSATWTQCVTTACATVTSAGASATVTQINAALSSASANTYVLLPAGTYTIAGTIQLQNNTVLRGAGTLLTILHCTGTGGSTCVNMGNWNDAPGSSFGTNITSGATAGSTSIVVASASGYTVGGYIEISELNDLIYVTDNTINGTCTFCDQFSGTRTRRQIAQITSISGTTFGITPPLYKAYGAAAGTSPAVATPFFGGGVQGAPDGSMEGVENLQIYATNSGYSANVGITMCVNCWVKGVFSNFADGDHVDIFHGYHDEVRDSYFTNAFTHTPGGADSDVLLSASDTGCKVENNILERLHSSIIMEWGASGCVVAYNYTIGEYDTSNTNVMQESLVTDHGAHPQFNLIEGNITGHLISDGFWGSSSDTTFFRNQARGTTPIAPFVGGGYTGRAAVNWSAAVNAYQYTRGFTMAAYTSRYNVIDNISGSADIVSVMTAKTGTLNHSNSGACTACTVPSQARCGATSLSASPCTTSQDSAQFNSFDFGYDTTSDNSGAGIATFAGGPSNTAGFWVGTWLTDCITGNWDIASTTTVNNLHCSGASTTFPASYYLTAKPSWFGSVPFPAIGSDVTGGNVDTSTLAGHVNAIPALVCYNAVGKDANGLLNFDPNVCYYSGTVTPTVPSSILPLTFNIVVPVVIPPIKVTAPAMPTTISQGTQYSFAIGATGCGTAGTSACSCSMPIIPKGFTISFAKTTGGCTMATLIAPGTYTTSQTVTANVTVQ